MLLLIALLSSVFVALPSPAANADASGPVALSVAADENGQPVADAPGDNGAINGNTINNSTVIGLGLLVVGAGLVIAEAFLLSFGVLGLGGVVAFLIGASLLMESGPPAVRTALPVIAAVGVGLVLLLIVLVRLALKAHRARLVTGDRQLIGEIAVALDDFDGAGQARLHGEVWQVEAAGPVRRGDRLRVRARHGLTLDVEIES